MMMVGGAIVVVLGVVLFFAFNGPSESQGTDTSNPNSQSGTVLQGSTDSEDTLFNNYISCMGTCRESSDSDSCIASECYPTLTAGLQELGYSSRGPDAEFISKLSTKNKAFISCSSECDYLEESEMDSCLDDCFASR